MRPAVLARIVSGGQTGVDRAALDVALVLGLDWGGWCPKGRRAEDGMIDLRYPLIEAESEDYAERTWLNVRDSDATLVLARGRPSGGTALTLEFAKRLGRPHRVVDLAAAHAAPAEIGAWIADLRIRVLNLAGPRESNAPGIHDEAADFLRRLLA